MRMNLMELIDMVCAEGYSQANAEARVSQKVGALPLVQLDGDHSEQGAQSGC